MSKFKDIRTCWLSEQIPVEEMIQMMKENKKLGLYIYKYMYDTS